jgi:hypothetical protein
MTRNRNYPQGNQQQSLAGQSASKMMTITYDDKVTPWSRGNYLMGTRLLPSCDDSDKNFSEPLADPDKNFSEPLAEPELRS